MPRKLTILFLVLLWGLSAEANQLKLQDLQFEYPQGWKLHQQALDGKTQILGFENPEGFVSFFISPNVELNLRQLIADPKALVVEKNFESPTKLNWEWLELKHGEQFTILFALTIKDHRYYGYSHSTSAEISKTLATTFLNHLDNAKPSRSLTGPDYSGKKYYVGFGDHLSGFMGNEVKYDIAHTHDIFTKDIGGNYLGTQLVGSGIGEAELNEKWKELKDILTEKDMYVQYSSGHGSHTGLMFGPSYRAIRDNALSYPAKEIIIFTMSCYSGNLVDSFNEKKADWEDWQSQGRTLMVMSSSKAGETSSTGPGHDEEEPNGPNGSAGSAFGHSLWKALIGHADGAVEGVKDGYLSLGEIREFTIKKTQEVGGHTPTVTGAYNDNLLMVKVPDAQFVKSLEGGTEGLSEAQIMQRIQELNQEWAIRK